MGAQTIRLVGMAIVAALGFPAAAAPAVEQRFLAAHEAFLASDALHGRGSATPDEAVAAAYVAAQFEAAGLLPAPGQTGFLQSATIDFPVLGGTPRLTVDGTPVAATLLFAGRDVVSGPLAMARGATLPAADVVAVTGTVPFRDLQAAAFAQHVKLLILAESKDTQRLYARNGATPPLLPHLGGEPAGGITVATVPAADLARLARPGVAVELTIPLGPPVVRTTTNAVGYLPGTDPAAGLLLLTAHLDHLGVVKGFVMPGANDDASGTAAVLELARVLGAGDRPRRGILFVAYGSEEAGEFGSQYFARHPPVPLDRIAANIEFEMVGVQDPKLPAGALMMTGFDRSNVGPAFQQHGGQVVADPYPAEHFFERSDNYQLALQGVVAHTVSGWAQTPTYHRPTDTIANLDLPFMTRAVQSLVAPLEWLANAPFAPAWRPGGRPLG